MAGAVLTGGCLCGGVRFEVTEPPVTASYCHCTRCQKRTGTAASVQVRIAHGRPLLEAKIEAVAPKLLIFVFKETAKKLWGPFPGNGLLAGRTMGGAKIFVMPGPYAPRGEVTQRLRELGELF
jgi:hypothetical protein